MKILEHLKPVKQSNNFNVLPDGVFTVEQDGRIVDVNDKLLKMYNASRFDIVGKYFSDCVENGTNVLNEVIRTKRSACAKAIIKDDEYGIILEINTVKNEETQKIYVTVRDVTEKQKEYKMMSDKYSMAQSIIDEKNKFLLMASGGLLSDLVSISGFAKALLNGIGGALSEKQDKYLNLISSGARDLSYDLEKLFTVFKAESGVQEYNRKNFDLIALFKSINRIYEQDIKDKKITFNFDYSRLTQRDCDLDPEIVEYILRCIMEIFIRFTNLGKCSLSIGHPPIDFLKTRDFSANVSQDPEQYILFEAKITDLVFSEDEISNIFNTYYKGATKRPIGLKASMYLLKRYITDFGGDIWVYSKESFGTMITFVLPLK